MTVAVVVLAAGGSRRLGHPKQLLPWGTGTLLDAVLAAARQVEAGQVVVTLGAAEQEVRARVDLTGVEVASNPGFGEGCASSIRAALDLVRPDADGLVLLLGDQPGVDAGVVDRLAAQAGAAAIGLCRYDDGCGHPLWFHRRMFEALRGLHGDKAVWKLVEAAGAEDVVEVRVPGPVPPDVDTWEDYQALLTGGPAVRR